MADLIVADASWVVALRDPDDAHHDQALGHDGAFGDRVVMLAAVTFAECLVHPAHLGRLTEVAEMMRAAFRVEVPDDAAPERWAARRAASGLRLPDAIVLETALHVEAGAIATFDDRLAAAARQHELHVYGG